MRLVGHREALAGVPGLYLPEDLVAVEEPGDLSGALPLTVELESGVVEGVDEEPIPQNPLLVAPIAGGLLGHEALLVRALVGHPQQGLARRARQEARLTRKFAVAGEGDEEQGRGVAGAKVSWVVDERGDVAEGCLVFRERPKDPAQARHQPFVAVGEDAQGGDEQIARVRLGVSPTRRPGQAVARPPVVVEEDLQRRLPRLFDRSL